MYYWILFWDQYCSSHILQIFPFCRFRFVQRRHEFVRTCCKLSPAPDDMMRTSSSHQDLGVVVTDDLRWTDHIQKISGMAFKMIYLLERQFRGCSPKRVQSSSSPGMFGARYFNSKRPDGRSRPSYKDRLVVMGLTTFASRRLLGDLIVTFRTLHHRFDGHNYKLGKEEFRSLQRQHFRN